MPKTIALSCLLAAIVLGAMYVSGAVAVVTAKVKDRREIARVERVQSGSEAPVPMVAVIGVPDEALERDNLYRGPDLPWRLKKEEGGCDWLKEEYPPLKEDGAEPWPAELTFCHAHDFHDHRTGIHVSKGAFTNAEHELSFTKPDGEIWIAAVGASSVELHSTDNLTWTRSLEEKLDGAGVDLKFRVHNFGISGTQSSVVRWRVENEIARRPYDFVVIYTGLNDGYHGDLFSGEATEQIKRYFFTGDLSDLEEFDPWFASTREYWMDLRSSAIEGMDFESVSRDHRKFEALLTDEMITRKDAVVRDFVSKRHDVDYDLFDSSALRTLPSRLVEGFQAVGPIRDSIRALTSGRRSRGLREARPILIGPPVNMDCIGHPAWGSMLVHRPLHAATFPHSFEEIAAFLTGPYLDKLEEIARDNGIPYVDVNGLWAGLACIHNSVDTVHAQVPGIRVLVERLGEVILDDLGYRHDLDSRRVIEDYAEAELESGEGGFTTRSGYSVADVPVSVRMSDGRLDVSPGSLKEALDAYFSGVN